MILTRRRFTSTLLASLMPPLDSVQTPSQKAGVFEWRELAPGVRLAVGAGGHVLAVGTGRDVVLVDSKDLGFGPSLRESLTAQGLRATHVVLTHHHLDHAGGLHVFADAHLVGQARAAIRVPERLRDAIVEARAAGTGWTQAKLDDLQTWTTVGPTGADDLRRFATSVLPVVAPDHFGLHRTFDDDWQVEGAPERIELRHRGPGHTDNDTFVFFPERDLLHAGDLLFHQLHPFIAVNAGGTTRGWERCLDAMIAVCTPRTRVVPGHGPITDVSGLRAQKAYFQQMRDAVADAMRRGLSREAITKSTPPAFASYGWPNMAADALGVLYDELKAAP